MKRYILITLSAFFIIAIVSFYSLFYTPLLPSHNPSATITIDKNATATSFVHLLNENHYIHSSKIFLLLIELKGLSHHLKAGKYEIKSKESFMQLLDKVVKGEVLTHNFTIIAGTTQNKIDQDLKQSIDLEYHPEDWNLIKENYPNAEGLLLADTYQYNAGSISKTLLDQAHKNLIAYLNDAWQKKDLNLPYKTPYELLTAASIIEKETAVPKERFLISGIMVNRLNKGMPLQMDPTVIYGLHDDYKGKLSHQDLLVDSPYNSYRNRGLPPTPIAMVGKESINAAAHPEFTNYLYFVAKGDGTHQFSETYIEQRQAIHQFQHKDS